AAQRLEGWAASVRLSAAAGFADLRPADPRYEHGNGPGGCSPFAPDELGCALSCTGRQAAIQIGRGQLLRDLLPNTRGLLAAGQITEYKAILVCERDRLLDERGMAELDERMASRLAGKTSEQIRRAAARAVHAIDPTAAARRRSTAQRGRAVWFLPDPETGMTMLNALLGAAEARRFELRLRAMADAATTPGDTRSHGARMADALVDLAFLNPHTRQSDPTTTDGTDRQPADYPPSGGGQPHGDEQGCRHDDGRRSSDHGDESGTGCQHVVDTPIIINITVGADTLLHHSDQPGHLDGFGPIDASLARRLAHDRHAVWRRILTDPESGAVLDVGQTTYRPPAALHRHVRARDRTCRFPGCLGDAHRCQQDHTVPYAAGGPTADHNLGELCVHHHQLKHHAGWHLSQPEPGTFTWTTPTGARYTVEADAA
ncbi:MAG: DUF222 domain-containing protein, partial [Propionibacteriaceae bacterium]